jgi:hypothetical protein
MSKKNLRGVLEQTWVHSHEEDTDTEMVFRPETYDFPLARGRKSFALKPDGHLVQTGIAPTDARQETEGKWKLEGDHLAFYTKSDSEPSLVLNIASVDKDRLVVKK